MAKSIIESMKETIAKSGSSRKDIIFFKADTSRRIRFLQELDQGYVFQFHSDFNRQIYQLCDDPEDHENCQLCNEEVPIKEEYCWTVWDYDANEVRIFKTRMTSASAGPALLEMFEEFGTITDRDYKIKKVGKGTGSSFVVTPLEKSKFRGKAKVYSEAEMRDIMLKAYSGNTSHRDAEEEEVKPSKKEKKAKKEKSFADILSEQDWDTLKDIAVEFGVSKKELKEFDGDTEELVSYLLDEFEEDDLKEAYESLEEDEDE